MSADVSAPAPETVTAHSPALAHSTALDRTAAIAAPPKARVGQDGKAKRRATTSLWRLRRYMLPYRARFVLMIVFAGLGVAATIVVPLLTKAVIDGPIADSDRRGLYTLGAAAIGLGIVEAALIFGRRWIVAKGTLGVETGIRTDMYAKLQRLPMSFHGRWESGQLLSRMMNDLSTTRRFLGFGALFILMNIVQILVVTAILLSMYWPLGLVVFASIFPVAYLCLRNERQYVKLSRKVQDETGDVASSVEESAHGFRVIKAFGRGDLAYEKFDARSVQLFNTSIARVKLSSKFWTFLEVIPSLTLIIVLGLGAVAAGQGQLTLGTLVAFITLMLSLVWPVASLGFLLSMSQDAMTAADRIVEIFDAENEIPDGDRVIEEVRGHVRFEGAGFRFPDGDRDVLHDINLDIAPGETIAVVGTTGSGKTAFTALVPRLYDVTAGAITIDGVDIRDLHLSQLRSIVATAFEDPTLFSMSARENLTLGRPEATEEEIAEAVDVAQAHFVYDLPWGLSTRIGEQGMSLSGGQRQRLALARAVLARPSVLVLDDTLSALDIHTEALVEEALKRVLKRVTGIVVANRASTVLLADRVAMLSQGTIAHVGTHAELLETVPEYRELLSGEFNVEDELLEEELEMQDEALREEVAR
ncbi:MAG: ABC transporter ATP-binding protein [Propionibacteriaceae bacterium]